MIESTNVPQIFIKTQSPEEIVRHTTKKNINKITKRIYKNNLNNKIKVLVFTVLQSEGFRVLGF